MTNLTRAAFVMLPLWLAGCEMPAAQLDPEADDALPDADQATMTDRLVTALQDANLL